MSSNSNLADGEGHKKLVASQVIPAPQSQLTKSPAISAAPVYNEQLILQTLLATSHLT